MPSVDEGGANSVHNPTGAGANTALVWLEKIIEERDRLYMQKFEALDRATVTALNSAEKATLKSEVSTEERFKSHNEFRAQMKDMITTLANMKWVEAQFIALESKEQLRYDSLNEKINALTLQVSNTKSKSEGAEWLWRLIIGIIGIGIGIIGLGLAK